MTLASWIARLWKHCANALLNSSKGQRVREGESPEAVARVFGTGRTAIFWWFADCPARATGAALVMPAVSIEAMNKHLAEISRCVSPGAIALLILDGAGWHGSPQVAVLENIVLLPLPPYAPELNPVDPAAGSGQLGVSARQFSQPPRPGRQRGDPRRLS